MEESRQVEILSVLGDTCEEGGGEGSELLLGIFCRIRESSSDFENRLKRRGLLALNFISREKIFSENLRTNLSLF